MRVLVEEAAPVVELLQRAIVSIPVCEVLVPGPEALELLHVLERDVLHLGHDDVVDVLRAGRRREGPVVVVERTLHALNILHQRHRKGCHRGGRWRGWGGGRGGRIFCGRVCHGISRGRR